MINTITQILENKNIIYKNINNIIEKINNFEKSNIYIVSDFDGTITQGGYFNTWGLINESNLISRELKQITKDLYEYYNPIKINQNISQEDKDGKMKERTIKILNLYKEFELHKNIIEEIVNDSNKLNIRKGIKNFIKITEKENIPFLVLSSGLYNIIEYFFQKNGILLDNISIVGNKILFDNNGITEKHDNTIIHSENKNIDYIQNEFLNNIKNKNNCILLGDNILDIKMISRNENKNALKIGFLNKINYENEKIFADKFDIVIKNDESCLDVIDRILEIIIEKELF